MRKNMGSEATEKWDRRFLELAQHVSTWSKDPSTKVGAVIVDNSRRMISVGYNGFPKGVEDSHYRYHDRVTKYDMIVHAERNAILFANQPLTETVLYTYPFMPCCVCAGMIIQAGIKHVVTLEPTEEHYDRWGPSFNRTMCMFQEAGVNLVEHPTDFIHYQYVK